MIKFEDTELEESVIQGDTCIAVPIEIFKTKDSAVITTYKITEKAAKMLEEENTEKVLTTNVLIKADELVSPVMEKYGYTRFHDENELMAEYELKVLPKLEISANVEKIKSNEELEKLCENTGCLIELSDDNDLIFAVVENGRILSYAGINDLQDEEDVIEISVETDEDNRNLGYGAACVFSLCKHLLSNGKTVSYKCAFSNIASRKLCEKCGFDLKGLRYSFLYEHK